MSVTPFKVDIPQAKLDRLKQKLAAADFPDELEDSGWDYGSPLADIKQLTKYWHDEFDWRTAENELNQMPQFRTTIKIDGFDPVDLHFAHFKSSVPTAIPLLFCHGWPGSFDEVQKLLPFLLEGDRQNASFDIVAPSMPNYGFSSGIKTKGWGIRQTAAVFNKLMTDVLGYPEYVTQGGDVGYGVTRFMGYDYPQNCKASHYNMPCPNAPDEKEFPELVKKIRETPRTEADEDADRRSKWFENDGMGYYHEQATKPQTLGYGLNDSPVALLAWIYEKLHDWTDGYPWTPFEVCKWVSIYWFSTAGPTASLRGYYETRHTKDPIRPIVGSIYLKDIKIGTSKFPRELMVRPALWNHTLGDLVLNAVHTSGGHFAAFEKPEVLSNDLREMFGKGGGAYGLVKGRDGYA